MSTACIHVKAGDISLQKEDALIFDFRNDGDTNTLTLKTDFYEKVLGNDSHNLEVLPSFSVSISATLVRELLHDQYPNGAPDDLVISFAFEEIATSMYFGKEHQSAIFYPTYDFNNDEDQNNWYDAIRGGVEFSADELIDSMHVSGADDDFDEEYDRCHECGYPKEDCMCDVDEDYDDEEEVEEDEEDEDEEEAIFESDILQHLQMITDPDYYKNHAEHIFSNTPVVEATIENPVTLIVHRVDADKVNSALQSLETEEKPYYTLVRELEEHFKNEFGYYTCGDRKVMAIILDISGIAPRLKELSATEPENAVKWYDDAEGVVNFSKGLHAIIPDLHPNDIWELPEEELHKLNDMFLTVTTATKESIELNTLRTFYERLLS